MTTPVTCGHPDRPHKARGMCKPCWSRSRTGAQERLPGPTLDPVVAPSPVAIAKAQATLDATSIEDRPAPIKVSRPKRQAGVLYCPTDPEHGPLLASKDPARGWFCPHVDHDGRFRSHPLGEAPRSRATWSTAEAEAGQARL